MAHFWNVPLLRITSAIFNGSMVPKDFCNAFSEALNPLFASRKMVFVISTSKIDLVLPCLNEKADSGFTKISKRIPSLVKRETERRSLKQSTLKTLTIQIS